LPLKKFYIEQFAALRFWELWFSTDVFEVPQFKYIDTFHTLTFDCTSSVLTTVSKVYFLHFVQ